MLTPHIGGATAETIHRGIAMIADEIERFANGLPLGSPLGPAFTTHEQEDR